MILLRNYRIFTVTFTYDKREEVYNENLGDWTWGNPSRATKSVNVVASSKIMAEAWVLNFFRTDSPLISATAEEPIDSVIFDFNH